MRVCDGGRSLQRRVGSSTHGKVCLGQEAAQPSLGPEKCYREGSGTITSSLLSPAYTFVAFTNILNCVNHRLRWPHPGSCLTAEIFYLVSPKMTILSTASPSSRLVSPSCHHTALWVFVAFRSLVTDSVLILRSSSFKLLFCKLQLFLFFCLTLLSTSPSHINNSQSLSFSPSSSLQLLDVGCQLPFGHL